MKIGSTPRHEFIVPFHHSLMKDFFLCSRIMQDKRQNEERIQLVDKIVNAWQETRLKELCEENEKLQKQINNTKKTAKIKDPKRLSKKQCDRLVKKYRPKKRKRI